MRILITGIAGFVGSHTAESFLALGHEVIGIDNFNDHYGVALKEMNANAVRKQGADIIKMDLREADGYNQLPKDFDYIFHFAAQPGISQTSTFEDYLSNNVIATKYLLDFALECTQLKLFVNIGTSSIYGLQATFPEDVMARPASYYGVTKLAAEQLVLQKTREKKLRSCSLRLYSVIGPRERPEKMYSKLIDLGLKDKAFPLFEGSEKHLRSFTFVGDIVDGIISVVGKESVVDGEIFNLGIEAEHSTQDGINAVAEVIGKEIKIEMKPKRPGDQLRTKANIDKARRLLNYDPQTSLIDSVKAQVDWYKSYFL